MSQVRTFSIVAATIAAVASSNNTDETGLKCTHYTGISQCRDGDVIRREYYGGRVGYGVIRPCANYTSGFKVSPIEGMDKTNSTGGFDDSPITVIGRMNTDGTITYCSDYTGKRFNPAPTMVTSRAPEMPDSKGRLNGAQYQYTCKGIADLPENTVFKYCNDEYVVLCCGDRNREDGRVALHTTRSYLNYGFRDLPITVVGRRTYQTGSTSCYPVFIPPTPVVPVYPELYSLECGTIVNKDGIPHLVARYLATPRVADQVGNRSYSVYLINLADPTAPFNSPSGTSRYPVIGKLNPTSLSALTTQAVR